MATGARTIEVRVRFWTDPMVSQKKFKRSWDHGVVYLPKNPMHGIKSSSSPVPFNAPDELWKALRRAYRQAGVTMQGLGKRRRRLF